MICMLKIFLVLGVHRSCRVHTIKCDHMVGRPWLLHELHLNDLNSCCIILVYNKLTYNHVDYCHKQ